MIEIIIRTCGERTEKECVRLAEKQGNVNIVNTIPFSESIRQTYKLAIDLDEEYTTVIDSDVLLYENSILNAYRKLNDQPKNIFCLDGKTFDKTFDMARRAGVHIYRTKLLFEAMLFIDSSQLKPESYIRERMSERGYPTWAGNGIIFGKHDFEQYYCDLWRKSVCQNFKLERFIRETNIIQKWKKFSMLDNDYKVILAAHEYAKNNYTRDEIIIDKRLDFNAQENIANLGLKEKEDFFYASI